jgi:hypothetical protein
MQDHPGRAGRLVHPDHGCGRLLEPDRASNQHPHPMRRLNPPRALLAGSLALPHTKKAISSATQTGSVVSYRVCPANGVTRWHSHYFLYPSSTKYTPIPR